ncbi:MAG: hypothetical protein ACYTHJ_19495 [Planctomycetota bacterium]|jgi:hypothetical protein
MITLQLFFSSWLVTTAQAEPERPEYAPTSAYEVRDIQGWTVRIRKELLETNPELARDVTLLLDAKLYDVKRVIPPPAVKRLQEMAVWIERHNPDYPCACYHPSRQWLTENGYNPAKENSVEIANPANFLTWTIDQPYMVLHELAHGYHDVVLGHGHTELNKAYQAAVAAGTYESVLRFNGKEERHYALNNDQEYFAEATEAYYGTNDYYPFVRAELQKHDPLMYKLLPQLWNAAAQTAPPP